MKKQLFLFVFTIFLLFPAVCFSAYLINLKNGASILTNHYWEENGQIKFYRYGGVVGLPKSTVKNIEKTSKTYVAPADNIQVIGSDAAEKAGADVKAGAGAEAGEDKTEKREEKEKKEEKEIVLEKDPVIVQEFNRFKEQFKFAKILPDEERRKLYKDMFAFRKKISAQDLFYAYNKEEIPEIRSMLQELKKSVIKQ